MTQKRVESDEGGFVSVSPPQPPHWSYQPDEDPKRKHHWKESYAGFVNVDGVRIGKCPAGLTIAMAENLLNTQAVPYHNPKASGPVPDRLYVVHEGVVYRAVSTIAGKSFHGFPELPRRLRELPKSLRNRILSLADQLGCKEGVEEWMAR